MTETTAANSVLLADQVSQLLVQPLEAASVVLSSGPRIFDTSGVLRVPKIVGSSPVGFVGEGAEINSTHDTGFSEVTLMPTQRKSIKVIERYTRELIRQSVVGIDAVLRNRLVKVVSDQLDTALLTGIGAGNASEVQTVTITGTPTGGTFTLSFNGQTTAAIAYNAAAAAVQTALQALSTIGTGNATVTGGPGPGTPWTVTFAGALANMNVPQLVVASSALTGGTNPAVAVATTTPGDSADSITGLINQPGVQTGTWDTSDADTLLDGIGLATAAEVMPTRWFMNGKDFIKVRKLKEDSGTSKKYLLESDLTAGPTYRLFGVPVVVSNKLPSGKLVLADMSQVAVARDVAPSVTILTERYAEFDEIGIRIIARYDLGVLQPQAVIVLTDSTP